jgi:exodeoxyribonuclease VII small subunit
MPAADVPRLRSFLRKRNAKIEGIGSPTEVADSIGAHQIANGPLLPVSSVLNSALPMSSKQKTPGAAELNFEQAMERLESIVEQMESGKLPLEELIVRYEDGMRLVKICQERLASAEQKIEIIARNSAGKPVVKEFEPAAEITTENASAPTEANQHDEVTLF